MADKLVTQVSQDQDPAKAAELARLQAQHLAEQKKKKEQEQKASTTSTQEEEQPQGNCCWRFFCCCFSRRRPKPVPQSPPPPKSGGDEAAPVTAPPVVVAPTPEPDPATTAKGGQKFLLPPIAAEHKGRKTLVLDLDETLVHSSFRPVPGPDFIISIELDGVTHRVYVQKRPGVDNFLEQVGAKFEVVVFTASLDKYANPVLDILDPKGFVHFRLFREACVQHYGNYVKDLSLLGRRLEDTLIIDNSPFSYMFQPDNAIPITSWFNDKSDRELYELVPFLHEQIAPAEDVAQIIVERKQMAMSQGGGTEVGAGDEEEEDEQ